MKIVRFLLPLAGVLAGLFPFNILAGTHSWDVAVYDRLLAQAPPGATTVALGDMVVAISTVQRWRDALASEGEAVGHSASESGINLWPGGNVIYDFSTDAGSAVSPAHQIAFQDAATEWTMFANVHFTRRTTETDYVLVNDGGPSLVGGNSRVGKFGGAQALNIGSSSWNRGTLTHEIGHALGLIHEHQRSDRDMFVTILTQNIQSGSESNFTLIPGSINNGPYDFLSVMHYARNALSIDSSLDTIEPVAAFSQYLNIIGVSPDRILSRGDRDGMVLMYGVGPALSTVVTNTSDVGVGSLRAAIYHALDLETNNPGTLVTISFQIPVTDPGFSNGVFTIKLVAQLPAPGPGTTIDGTTQTLFTGDTNPNGPEVALDGSLAQPPDAFAVGMRLSEAGCVIKGLAIGGFPEQGVLITGTGAIGNTVSGCYIGATPDGTAANANAFLGIQIDGGANGNLIGGTSAAARNVISANTFQGILLRDAATQSNTIAGNYIGTNGAGTAALANGRVGIDISLGAHGNTVGGSAAGNRNVISGNSNQGIIIHDAGTSGNMVAGNYLGLNAAGTAAIPNVFEGVTMYGGASGNIVGGTTSGARNIVSGNATYGVACFDAGTSNNIIEGNYIGLNPAGSGALGNAFAGVGIFGGATANVVGGVAAGTGNVISGNSAQGIFLAGAGASGNVVQGNLIGLNAAGTLAVPNSFAGVEIGASAQNNLVGGTTVSARNIISGNQSQGVAIGGIDSGVAASGNMVYGNYLGLDPTGTTAIPNGFAGVEIYPGGTANFIGGPKPGMGNVISGNSSQGVAMDAATGAPTTGNIIAGNLIGLNAAGTSAVPNSFSGVEFFNSASSNTVGGAAGSRNYISGNSSYGVAIDGGSSGNSVQGNTIGFSPTGTALANVQGGVIFFGGAQANTLGGTSAGAANTISGNSGRGVDLFDSTTTGNFISGNSIYGNSQIGINLVGGSENGSLVTANDPGDGDTGPNNLQNYPVLTSAVLGIGTTVQGALHSTASNTYRIEFFAGAVADPSGFGPGQTYLGSLSVTTNGSGDASFNTTLPAVVPAGQILCATATDAGGNTSEFSANVVVTSVDSDGDGLPDVYENAHPRLHANLNDAAGDVDGDGLTNLAEFRAGTAPDDPTSTFRLSRPVLSGADVVLNLPAVVGHTYRFEYADDLSAPNHWRTLADQVFATGVTLQITDPGATALRQRFYRAVAVP